MKINKLRHLGLPSGLAAVLTGISQNPLAEPSDKKLLLARGMEFRPLINSLSLTHDCSGIDLQLCSLSVIESGTERNRKLLRQREVRQRRSTTRAMMIIDLAALAIPIMIYWSLPQHFARSPIINYFLALFALD